MMGNRALRRAAVWTITLLVPMTAVVVGVAVTAYLTAQKSNVVVEGDPPARFDAEIGFVPAPNAVSRRTHLDARGRPYLSYTLYTDDREQSVASGPKTTRDQRNRSYRRLVWVGSRGRK